MEFLGRVVQGEVYVPEGEGQYRRVEVLLDQRYHAAEVLGEIGRQKNEEAIRLLLSLSSGQDPTTQRIAQFGLARLGFGPFGLRERLAERLELQPIGMKVYVEGGEAYRYPPVRHYETLRLQPGAEYLPSSKEKVQVVAITHEGRLGDAVQFFAIGELLSRNRPPFPWSAYPLSLGVSKTTVGPVMHGGGALKPLRASPGELGDYDRTDIAITVTTDWTSQDTEYLSGLLYREQLLMTALDWWEKQQKGKALNSTEQAVAKTFEWYREELSRLLEAHGAVNLLSVQWFWDDPNPIYGTEYGPRYEGDTAEILASLESLERVKQENPQLRRQVASLYEQTVQKIHAQLLQGFLPEAIGKGAYELAAEGLAGLFAEWPRASETDRLAWAKEIFAEVSRVSAEQAKQLTQELLRRGLERSLVNKIGSEIFLPRIPAKPTPHLRSGLEERAPSTEGIPPEVWVGAAVLIGAALLWGGGVVSAPGAVVLAGSVVAGLFLWYEIRQQLNVVRTLESQRTGLEEGRSMGMRPVSPGWRRIFLSGILAFIMSLASHLPSSGQQVSPEPSPQPKTTVTMVAKAQRAPPVQLAQASATQPSSPPASAAQQQAARSEIDLQTAARYLTAAPYSQKARPAKEARRGGRIHALIALRWNLQWSGYLKPWAGYGDLKKMPPKQFEQALTDEIKPAFQRYQSDRQKQTKLSKTDIEIQRILKTQKTPFKPFDIKKAPVSKPTEKPGVQPPAAKAKGAPAKAVAPPAVAPGKSAPGKQPIAPSVSKAELQQLREEQKKAQASLKALHEKRQQVQGEVKTLEQQKQTLGRQLKDLRVEIAQAEALAKAARRPPKSVQEAERQARQLQAEVRRLQDEKQRQQKALAELEANKKEAQERTAALTQERDRLSQTLSELRQRTQQAQGAAQKAQADLEVLAKQKNQAEQELKRLQEDQAKLKAEVETLKSEKSSAEQRLERLRQGAQQLQKRVEAFRQEVGRKPPLQSWWNQQGLPVKAGIILLVGLGLLGGVFYLGMRFERWSQQRGQVPAAGAGPSPPPEEEGEPAVTTAVVAAPVAAPVQPTVSFNEVNQAVSSLRKVVDGLERRRKELAEGVEKLQKEVEGQEGRAKALEEAARLSQESSKELESKDAQLQSAAQGEVGFAELLNLIEELENERERFKESLRDLEEWRDRLESELENITQRESTVAKEIGKLAGGVAKAAEELNKAQQDFQTLHTRRRRFSIGLFLLRNSLKKVQQQQHNLKTQRGQLASDVKELRDAEDRLRQSSDQIKETLKTLQQGLDSRKNLLEQLRAQEEVFREDLAAVTELLQRRASQLAYEAARERQRQEEEVRRWLENQVDTLAAAETVKAFEQQLADLQQALTQQIADEADRKALLAPFQEAISRHRQTVQEREEAERVEEMAAQVTLPSVEAPVAPAPEVIEAMPVAPVAEAPPVVAPPLTEDQLLDLLREGQGNPHHPVRQAVEQLLSPENRCSLKPGHRIYSEDRTVAVQFEYDYILSRGTISVHYLASRNMIPTLDVSTPDPIRFDQLPEGVRQSLNQLGFTLEHLQKVEVGGFLVRDNTTGEIRLVELPHRHKGFVLGDVDPGKLPGPPPYEKTNMYDWIQAQCPGCTILLGIHTQPESELSLEDVRELEQQKQESPISPWQLVVQPNGVALGYAVLEGRPGQLRIQGQPHSVSQSELPSWVRDLRESVKALPPTEASITAPPLPVSPPTVTLSKINSWVGPLQNPSTEEEEIKQATIGIRDHPAEVWKVYPNQIVDLLSRWLWLWDYGDWNRELYNLVGEALIAIIRAGETEALEEVRKSYERAGSRPGGAGGNPEVERRRLIAILGGVGKTAVPTLVLVGSVEQDAALRQEARNAILRLGKPDAQEIQWKLSGAVPSWGTKRVPVFLDELTKAWDERRQQEVISNFQERLSKLTLDLSGLTFPGDETKLSQLGAELVTLDREVKQEAADVQEAVSTDFGDAKQAYQEARERAQPAAPGTSLPQVLVEAEGSPLEELTGPPIPEEGVAPLTEEAVETESVEARGEPAVARTPEEAVSEEAAPPLVTPTPSPPTPHPPPANLQALIDQLADPDDKKREAARQAIAQQFGPKAVPWLLKVLQEGMEHQDARRAQMAREAAFALGEIAYPDPDSAEAGAAYTGLYSALTGDEHTDPGRAIRSGAARGLADLVAQFPIEKQFEIAQALWQEIRRFYSSEYFPSARSTFNLDSILGAIRPSFLHFSKGEPLKESLIRVTGGLLGAQDEETRKFILRLVEAPQLAGDGDGAHTIKVLDQFFNYVYGEMLEGRRYPEGTIPEPYSHYLEREIRSLEGMFHADLLAELGRQLQPRDVWLPIQLAQSGNAREWAFGVLKELVRRADRDDGSLRISSPGLIDQSAGDVLVGCLRGWIEKQEIEELVRYWDQWGRNSKSLILEVLLATREPARRYLEAIHLPQGFKNRILIPPYLKEKAGEVLEALKRLESQLLPRRSQGFSEQGKPTPLAGLEEAGWIASLIKKAKVPKEEVEIAVKHIFKLLDEYDRRERYELPMRMEQTKESDAEARWRDLVGSLKKMGSAALFPLIAQLELNPEYTSSNLRFYWIALRALHELDFPETVVSALIDTLKDKNPVARRVVAMVLGFKGIGEAIPFLIERLKDKALDVRQEAAEALGAIPDPRSVPPLISSLRDRGPFWRIHWAAKYTLRTPGMRRFSSSLAVLEKKYSQVRVAAAYALGRIGDQRAVLPLIAALKDESPELRKAAAHALGEIGSSEAGPPLVEALKDSEENVQAKAAEALVRIADPTAIHPLIKNLVVVDPSVPRKKGDPRIVPFLILKLKKETDLTVQGWAFYALLRILPELKGEELAQAKRLLEEVQVESTGISWFAGLLATKLNIGQLKQGAKLFVYTPFPEELLKRLGLSMKLLEELGRVGRPIIRKIPWSGNDAWEIVLPAFPHFSQLQEFIVAASNLLNLLPSRVALQLTSSAWLDDRVKWGSVLILLARPSPTLWRPSAFRGAFDYMPSVVGPVLGGGMGGPLEGRRTDRLLANLRHLEELKAFFLLDWAQERLQQKEQGEPISAAENYAAGSYKLLLETVGRLLKERVVSFKQTEAYVQAQVEKGAPGLKEEDWKVVKGLFGDKPSYPLAEGLGFLWRLPLDQPNRHGRFEPDAEENAKVWAWLLLLEVAKWQDPTLQQRAREELQGVLKDIDVSYHSVSPIAPAGSLKPVLSKPPEASGEAVGLEGRRKEGVDPTMSGLEEGVRRLRASKFLTWMV